MSIYVWQEIFPIHFILPFLARNLFSEMYMEMVFDKIFFPIYFILPFLAGIILIQQFNSNHFFELPTQILARGRTYKIWIFAIFQRKFKYLIFIQNILNLWFLRYLKKGWKMENGDFLNYAWYFPKKSLKSWNIRD